MGLDDLMAGSDDRWAKAERYARGYADNGMGEVLRIYYTRYFPAGVILYAAFLVLVGPLVSGDGPTDWLFVAQGGAALFGLLAAVAGLIYNAKRLRPRVELASNLAIVFPLEKDEQKYLRRVINGKEPAPQDPVRLSVARSVAVQTRKTHATNLLVVPLYSYCLGNVAGPLSIFWIILSPVFVITTIIFVREFRETGHFLAATAPRATAT